MIGAHSFDWYAISRQEIINYMQLITHTIADCDTTEAVVYKLISSHLKCRYPIVFKKYRSGSPNPMHISGKYYPSQDSLNRRPIQIGLHFNKLATNLHIDSTTFIQIYKLIADTILHEILHMHQYRTRKFKSLTTHKKYVSGKLYGYRQHYYGQLDEIEAYSFNIACEMLDDSILAENCTSYQLYVNNFNQDLQHPALVLLNTKIKSYLPNALIGKPVHSSKNITTSPANS